MYLVGDPYKPSFATVTGRGHNPTYNRFFVVGMPKGNHQHVFFFSNQRSQNPGPGLDHTPDLDNMPAPEFR